MSDRFPLSAIILAGGKSSRMGKDKALLPFGGETMLEHITELVSPLFEETLVIVNDPAKTRDLHLDKAKVYKDLFQGRGPLAGIYTGLSNSRSKASCVFTCDMPFIDRSFIRNLVEFWCEDRDALCCEDAEGKLQPFPGIYSGSCRFLIRTLLDQGKKSVRHFLEAAFVKPLILKKEKTEVFMNMNTIEDYYHVLSAEGRIRHLCGGKEKNETVKK